VRRDASTIREFILEEVSMSRRFVPLVGAVAAAIAVATLAPVSMAGQSRRRRRLPCSPDNH
jgi:hypothetical protein